MPALEKKWLINENTVEVCCLLEQLKSAKEHIEITIDAEDNEIIYIGSELPSEYAGSVYTKKLKGADAKAKANMTEI